MKSVFSLLGCLFIALAAQAVIIPDGEYIIYTSYEGLYCLDVSNARMAAGTNIQLWETNGTDAQVWIVENHDLGIVLRSSIDRNYVIDVSNSRMANGTNIQLWPYNGTKAQLWYPRKVEGNTFVLCSAVDSDYVLDLSNSRVASGTNIHLWRFNDTNAQKWVFSGDNLPGTGLLDWLFGF